MKSNNAKTLCVKTSLRDRAAVQEMENVFLVLLCIFLCLLLVSLA